MDYKYNNTINTTIVIDKLKNHKGKSYKLIYFVNN